MKVEVGQIWSYYVWTHVYKITKIEPLPLQNCFRVWADMLRDGETLAAEIVFGHLDSDGTPRWGTEWVCENAHKEKSFTRLGTKTLRKRMREQIAAQFLTSSK